jgi:hypothetical protein
MRPDLRRTLALSLAVAMILPAWTVRADEATLEGVVLEPRQRERRGGGGAIAVLLLAGGAAGAGVALRKQAEADAKMEQAPAPSLRSEAFRGTFVVGEKPSASVTAGPAAAGTWTADLSWAPSGVVLEAVVFTTSGVVIARSTASGPASARAEWAAAAGAVHRIELVLAQPGNVKSVDWELKVTYPSP